MVLKNISFIILGAVLLAWNSASMADQYRADEFFGLDSSDPGGAQHGGDIRRNLLPVAFDFLLNIQFHD